LQQPPARLDAAFLRANYQDFRDFVAPQPQSSAERPIDIEREQVLQQDAATPEESLEAAYQN
jgi:hypothetical protein